MDEDIRKMMEDKFGPPDRAEDADPKTGDNDRTAWGMRKVDELSSTEHEATSLTRWLVEIPQQVAHAASAAAAVCFQCSAGAPKAGCSKCHVARYCSRECQVKHWKGSNGHKKNCERYSLLGKAMVVPESSRRDIVEKIIASVRLYLCPFAVAHAQHGRGFVFVQSECSLAELALPLPVDCSGKRLELPRALFLHFVSIAEYDEELRREEEREASRPPPP